MATRTPTTTGLTPYDQNIQPNFESLVDRGLVHVQAMGSTSKSVNHFRAAICDNMQQAEAAKKLMDLIKAYLK